MSHNLEDARDAVTNKVVDILSTYKVSMTTSGTGASAQLNIADNLKMLPLLCLGLVKHMSPQFPPLHALDRSGYGTAQKSLLISEPTLKRC